MAFVYCFTVDSCIDSLSMYVATTNIVATNHQLKTLHRKYAYLAATRKLRDHSASSLVDVCGMRYVPVSRFTKISTVCVSALGALEQPWGSQWADLQEMLIFCQGSYLTQYTLQVEGLLCRFV